MFSEIETVAPGNKKMLRIINIENLLKCIKCGGLA